MNNRGLKEIMKSRVEGKPLALATFIVFLLGGSLLSFIGYGVGVMFSLLFGLPVPFEYGGAPGYEGMALFGGMCGSALFTLALIAAWLRRRTILRWVVLVYLALWVANVIVMHFAVIVKGSAVFALLPIPAVLIGIIISVALYISPSTTHQR